MQLKKLFKDIKTELNQKDPLFISELNRIILCGGLSKLRDLEILTSELLKAPAQVAGTKDEGLKDPEFSPVVGVTNYVLSLGNKEKLSDIKEDLTKEYPSKNIFTQFLRFITDLM